MEMIERLEAALLEQIRQAEADQQAGELLMRRGIRERKRAAMLLKIVMELRAAMGTADDETGETPAASSGSGLEPPATDAPAYQPGTIITGMLGRDFWRRHPDVDENSGDPIYDICVVSGKGTSRERALAAARVYGYRLKESALADAIFRTGETNASSSTSIRGSLGGLVKYGEGWRRDRGWLVYTGEDLDPDWATLRRLAGEGESLQNQVSQEEGTDQIALSDFES